MKRRKRASEVVGDWRIWARVHLGIGPEEFKRYTFGDLMALRKEWLEREAKHEHRLARLLHSIARGPVTTKGSKEPVPFSEFFIDPRKPRKKAKRRAPAPPTLNNFLSALAGTVPIIDTTKK